MKLLWAVIQDLFSFVWQSFFDVAKHDTKAVSTLPERKLPLALMPETPPVLLVKPAVPVLIPSESSAGCQTSFLPQVTYVSTESAPLYLDTALQVDGVIAYLPYATALSVVGAQGLFWRVVHKEGTAWVEKSMTIDDKDAIYPTFTTGNYYLALDTETKKLRRLIKDEFYTVRVHSPLLDIEYMHYRLQNFGRTIDWSGINRPRQSGTWHSLLRGRRDVVIRISPKTGSIMECGEGEQAFLAYVESVSPDETVSIASVGRYKPGQFMEEVLTKSEWQVLQPLWLQIS